MPRIGLSVFLVLIVGCSEVAVLHAPRDVAGNGPARVIDAHTHFEDADGKVLPGPSAKMYEEFAENHIVGAVVHASRKDAPPVLAKNTQVKFALCAAVVPKRTLREVERGIREGKYQCMKVYLAYVPLWATDPFYRPFYKLAEKYDVPVVFHTGDPYDKMAKVKYADPLTVDEIAVSFPKVKFVLAHMGNPWLQSAAEVVYKNDNVYCDTSALMLGDLSKADPEAVDDLMVRPMRWFFHYVENPKKILFGTDWPLVNIKSYIDVVKRAVPKKDWDDVFYNNAVRVFRTLGSKGN